MQNNLQANINHRPDKTGFLSNYRRGNAPGQQAGAGGFCFPFPNNQQPVFLNGMLLQQ
jgi:hypothetical protein